MFAWSYNKKMQAKGVGEVLSILRWIAVLYDIIIKDEKTNSEH